jgi:hypothetical protein
VDGVRREVEQQAGPARLLPVARGRAAAGQQQEEQEQRYQ